MISATFLRSSLPWLVSSSKVNGLPSLASIPLSLRFQPGLGEQRRGPLGIVGDALDVGVVRPEARPERTGGLAPEPEHDAFEQLLLVDGVGERLAHPTVGEARVLEVEAEVGVAGAGVADTCCRPC